MNSFSIKVFKPNSTESVQHELPLDDNNSECTIHLRTPVGADGLHLVLLESNEPKLRLEMTTSEKEDVFIKIKLDEEGNPQIMGNLHDTFILPLAEHYSSNNKLISPPKPEQHIEIAIIIDATMRVFVEEKITENGVEERKLFAKLLIEQDKEPDQKRWAEYANKLTDFIEAISKDTKYKVAILAFGDQKQPHINAPELTPRYKLWPEKNERVLQPLNTQDIKNTLQNIEATSGGDFVDALADAMMACHQLHWHENSRKLVIMLGDSPGHSLIEPILKGGDLCARQADVDTAAMLLHDLGIEILSIYNAPSEEASEYFKNNTDKTKLLEYTKKQYQKLASYSELAFQISEFEPETAAKRFCNRDFSIGRGMMFGELVEEEQT